MERTPAVLAAVAVFALGAVVGLEVNQTKAPAATKKLALPTGNAPKAAPKTAKPYKVVSSLAASAAPKIANAGDGLPWRAVYIVEMTYDGLDIVAANATAATAIAPQWSRSTANPSMEFPYPYSTRDQAIAADQANNTALAFAPYPDDTRPFVNLTERHTIYGATYATTTAPAHSKLAKLPTLAQWQATVAANPNVTWQPHRLAHEMFAPDVRQANRDNPNHAGSDHTFRRLYVVTKTHVWYYQAATAADAVAQATAQWIIGLGGVYGAGRQLTLTEAAWVDGQGGPDLTATFQPLATNPWDAYDASLYEPATSSNDRLVGGCWETVASSEPTQMPPFDPQIAMP